MTFAETRTRMPVGIGLVATVATAAAVAILARATGQSPVEVAVPIVGVIGGVAVLRSPTLALSLLISSAFFEGYLTRTGFSLTKVIGLAAVLAWGIDWALRHRRPVTTPHMLWLIGLAVWMATSVLIAGERSNAMSTSARYASFFVLFFLTVQVASRGRGRLELLVTVTVASAAAAAAAGLFDYAVVHHGRAAGPLAGANDFAFLLGSTLPLAVWRFRWAGAGWPRLGWSLAALMIAATTVTTLSRGAAVGLAAGFLWLVLAGRVRPRWLLAAALVVAAGWALSATVFQSEVSSATATKEQVASSNVQSRLYYWQIAFDEFKSAPITGVGAGNYRVRFTEFGLPFAFDTGAQGTHNTYLNILAELGLTGLVLFIGYLITCWRDLRMRFADRRADELQSALAAAFVTACIAAVFLTEQFYAPLWVLPALGVAAVLRVRGGARL